jgi:hypothetical protein
LKVHEILEEFRAKVSALAVSIVQKALTYALPALLDAIRKPLEGTTIYTTVIAIDTNRTDDERMAAIDRLAASAAFSRRALFHPSRWAALAGAFASYCTERRLTAKAAWDEIIRPALVLGLSEAEREAAEKPLIEFWHTARREVRREIEKTILDGRTLDQQGDAELPENEVALSYWFDFEPEGGLGEQVPDELLRQIFTLLTPRELQAIIDHPTDLAGRVARSRALAKLRKAGIKLTA